MALNLEQLLKAMLPAAESALGAKWPLAASIAKTRFKALAQILINIEQDKLHGDLTESEAKDLFAMHKKAVKGALESLQGVETLLAEAAINAAMAAIKGIANTAIGWTLII
jgi:hypothetical protein